MSQLVQINNFANKFSDNILPITSVFSDDSTVVNITSGTGGISFFKNPLFGYYFGILNTAFTTTDLSFNFGDALFTTITEAGIYRFQLSIFDVDSGANTFLPFDFEVLVYKNGVYSETLEGTFDYDSSEYSNKLVTFCQEIVCDNSITDLDFSFNIKHDVSAPVSNTSFQFCNLKLELDNKFLGTVSPYSLPFDYYSNTYTGWAYYVDSLATPTVVIGTTYTQITIDGLGATIDDYLPKEIRGIHQLWTGSKITPISVGDDYDGRFDCTITAKTGSPTAIELIIDISGGVAGSNKAFTGWIQAIGTAPYDQSMPLDYFSLATFLANGGKLYARVDTGTVTIGRRNIKISRKSKTFV